MTNGTIERIFRKLWYETPKGSGGMLFWLLPFSLLYGLIVTLRNRRFDRGFVKSERLPCPVISIGNITVGGTGKTPMVIGLVRMLREQGFRPAVLSRGYGGKSKHPVNVVADGTQILMNQRDSGDEPVLIAKSVPGVPVLTGPRRVLTGDWALKNLDADVLILDDGFQHRQLFRNIDIVLHGAANPFGNGQLFPGGPLREPPGALKRADIIIATGTFNDIASDRPLALPDGVSAPVFRCYYEPRKLLRGLHETVFPPELVKGKKICAFAGIGNPAAFEKTLCTLGAEISVFIPFPDHHRYTRQDVSLILQKARQCGADMIVTTEKDQIKLAMFKDFIRDLWVLRIEMAFFAQHDDFIRLIVNKLKDAHKS